MAATNKLTKQEIRNLKPEARPYKKGDGGGCSCWCSPMALCGGA
ncbi:MAG: hypothetical protein U1E77_17655 [Inhella sp.]